MKKRIISFLTSFIMIFSLVANVSVTNVNAESTTAENQSEISADDSDVSIEGTNSFGNLLTDSLEEKMNQQEENNGCNIFSIEMIDESTAAVSFETLQDCMLVVGIYDETGKTMLASGSLEVYAGETDTYVDIETDSMPEYFYLKAFLIDSDCFRPLCNAYESPNYTQEMQEFLAQTTEDFDQEKVLNLDDDNTNNFAVFSEDTKIIPQTEDTNNVVSVDDENNVYVIENTDSSITSLQAGDTFAYEYGDNDVLIVKIADIKFDGTTATITGEDTSLEEAFDYIKIDTESNSADAQVDASNLEDGITYEGMIESEGDSEVQMYGVDLGGSTDLALSFKMNDKKIGSAKVSGSVEVKLSASAKVYISLSYQYIELKIDYLANAVLSLSDKGNGKMPLAYMCFSPIAGLIIEVTPSIVVETSVKAEVSGTLNGCVGFKASNTEGMVNLTKTPTFNPKIKIEGTIFVGISLEPKVKVISDNIASVSMTAKVGAEVKGVLSKEPANNVNASSIHECKNCIDGDINAKATLSFEVKFMNLDSLKFTLNLFNWSTKICDFYFSYDFAEFAFTSCPHYKYNVTVLVTYYDVNKVQGATVKIDDEEYQTDENGCVTVYLNNGNYKLRAQKSEVGRAQTTLTVDGNAIKKIMCLYKNAAIDGENNNDCKLSFGEWHSALITEDGSLYTWGKNSDGQLGNGTTTDSLTPIKIMDNVQSVSLGAWHSAAITKGGSLYTWGHNYNGQLGNGTTTDSLIPIKIMDNVQSVSLGENNSAAITKGGSLYTWGKNYNGQLGNGTETDSLTPIKIMDNVQSVSLGNDYSAAITKDGSLYAWGNIDSQLDNAIAVSLIPIKIMNNVQSVSLGEWHSALITEDGSLYTWGKNSDGQLGNGTKTDSRTSIKIMDNVQSVSLGLRHSAAITKDGSLYTWGNNALGQLGNGTETDSQTPIKLMDNVQLVSLGKWCSAVITKDGSLYTWGNNEGGQLGNGTTTDSQTPIKITIPVEIATASVTSPLVTTCTFSKSTLLTADISIKSFSDMRANEIYNVYAIKSADIENILDADNLLYITQVLSDENGTLSVSYGFDQEYDDPVWVAVPMTQTDISSAEITVDDLQYTGENQFVNPVVKLNGETLIEGESYYLEKDYSAVEPGEYTVIVTGSGLYKGSVEAFYKVSETNDEVLDRTAPTISDITSPSKEALTLKDTSATISFTGSEAGICFYMISETAPTSIDDFAMSDTDSQGMTVWTAKTGVSSVEMTTEAKQITLSNLSANTTYTLYLVAVDQAGNSTGTTVYSQTFTTCKTIPTVADADMPKISGNYGQTVADMILTPGTAKVGNDTITGIWAVTDSSKTDVPAVGTTNTYQVNFTPDASYNDKYDTVNVQVTPTVEPKPVTVTAENKTKIYGQENPVFTFTVPEGTLVGTDTKEDLGVTLSCEATAVSPVKEGGYAITGTSGSANYNVTVTQGTLTIEKADATITVGTETYNKTFGDPDFPLSDVTDTNTEANVQYEVTTGTDVITVSNGTVTILKAGTATITVSLPASTNYNAADTKTITVTVAKKSGYTVADINRSYLYSRDNADTIDLSGYLTADCGKVTYGTPQVNGDLYTGDGQPAVSNNGELSYKVKTGSVGTTGTIQVAVTTDNYADFTITVNVKLINQIPVSLKEGSSVTLQNSTLTYGQALSTLTFNSAVFVDAGGNVVTGTLAWKTPDATPNAGTTSATWVFTPNDASYATVEDAVAITVNKATPQVTNLPTVAARTYNPTVSLTNDDLTGGTVNVSGSWSWQTANIIPTVNNSGYVAVFTPSDSTNYETVTGTITVTVTKATPYIKTEPTAAAINYGDTLGASTLSGGTVQYSSSDATTVAGSFAWADSRMKPSVSDSDTTTYQIVFTPSDADNYNTVETDITLIVNKAQNAPNMPSSTMNVANSCEKVSDVTLPTGWVWQDADKNTELTVGTAVTATAEYNGADKGNYVNETVSVSITRSACDHAHTEVRNAKAATCKETGYTGDTYCTDCGELLTTGTTIPLADHQGGTATCTKKAVCTVCGQEYGELNANNHVHTEIRGAVAATCTAGGYTGDTYCTDCGVKTKTGTATPALGHNYTSKVTTEPTTDREGVRTYTCDRCGHSYTESIPKLDNGGSSGGGNNEGGSSSGGSSSGGNNGGGSSTGGSSEGGNNGGNSSTGGSSSGGTEAGTGDQPENSGNTTTITNEDGSTTTTRTETDTNGNTITTSTTVAADGSSTEKVQATATNTAGKEVAVTTTTKTDADGNVTSVTEKSVIDNITKDTTATITVKTGGDGNVTSAKASVTKTSDSTKVSLSGKVLDQITEAAGADVNVRVSMTVKDNDGKTKYTVQADVNEVIPGEKLYIYKLDTKTGKYTMVDNKKYEVTKAGTVTVNMTKKATYELVTAEESKAITKEILATVKPAKKSKSLLVKNTTTFKLSDMLDMDNIKRITYATSKKSVATITKKGTIKAVKAGTATVKATVTLKNGTKKTIKMTIKVK